jgi:hypothetical protein
MQKVILVHQMGKVGSTTVQLSLAQSDLKQPIIHTHILHQGDIEQNTKGKNSLLDYSFANISHNVVVSSYIRRALRQSHAGNCNWKVITLMRDPIARNISMFFQAASDRTMGLEQDYLKDAGGDVDSLIEIFTHQFGHKKYASWFDLHLNEPFGIDIFASEFPKSKGYQILKFPPHVEVLVFKLEKFNHCYKQAFAEFLGLEDFELININVASNKGYSDIYKQFLQKAKFPTEFLEAVYDSKVMRHFYSEAEVAGLIQKWAANEPTSLPTTIANSSFGQWWG